MAKLYDWGDGKGKIHTISKADHDANVKTQKAAAGRVAPPPPGTYDPNLDFQQGAEQREYDNTIDDALKGKLDLGVDLGLATNAAGTQKTRNLEDYNSGVGSVERSAGRSLSDLLTARTRGGEDYGTNIAGLQRQYQQLGDTQAQTARKAGVEATGGANLQSARKRAANEALDRAPIDTAYNRFMTDSGTSESRLGEDKATSLADLLRGYTRSGEDVDTNLGQTGLNYARGIRDLDTGVTRAGTAHDEYGLDINTAKQMQWGGAAVTGTGKPVPVDPYAAAKKKKIKRPTYTSGVTTP